MTSSYRQKLIAYINDLTEKEAEELYIEIINDGWSKQDIEEGLQEIKEGKFRSWEQIQKENS